MAYTHGQRHNGAAADQQLHQREVGFFWVHPPNVANLSDAI